MSKFEFNFSIQDPSYNLLHGNNEANPMVRSNGRNTSYYEINTVNRVAGFLAQCCHESANFRITQENPNYSSKASDAVFGKYFVRAGRDSKSIADNEKIANIVYANRMENGDTASGDGWRFRGRGIIPLTGPDNYTQFGKTLGYTAEQANGIIQKKPRCIRKCMLVLESPQHQQILRQARHYWHDPKN